MGEERIKGFDNDSRRKKRTAMRCQTRGAAAAGQAWEGADAQQKGQKNRVGLLVRGLLASYFAREEHSDW